MRVLTIGPHGPTRVPWKNVTINLPTTVLQKYSATISNGKAFGESEKKKCIEKTIAFSLRKLKREFGSGVLDENCITKADETHFVLIWTVAKHWDLLVTIADIVSGGEFITRMICISGGVNAMVHPPMLIFKNASRSHPIRGVPNDIPGVCYRTSPKAWMDSSTWILELSELRAIQTLLNGQKQLLFFDNCSSHVSNENVQIVLHKIHTTVPKFPANATDHVQPA